MIIFLFGEDKYRLRQKMGEIIGEYKKVHKSGLNLIYFDCQKESGKGFSDFGDLENGLKQTSMFKEKKLAVILNPLPNSPFKEKLLEKIKDFEKSKEIILICQEIDFDKRDSLFKALEKNSKTQEFKPLEGKHLYNFAENEFKKYGSTIKNPAIEKLLSYTGPNLWRLENEIKKLSAFKKGKEILEEDIESLVRPEIDTDIFKTVEAISQKNKRLAINLLHSHIEKGDSALYLLAMINYQFRNLLIIKDLAEKKLSYPAIIKKSGLHPFVVKKTLYSCPRFSFSELKKIYQKIFQIDLDIKTGKTEPNTALELLITEI